MCLGCNDPGGPARCPADMLATLEAKAAARDELADMKRQLEADLALVEYGLMEADPDALRAHLQRTEADWQALEWELGHTADLEPDSLTSADEGDYRAMDEQTLRQTLADRTNCDQYRQLLADRDQARDRMAAAQEDFNAASAAVDDADPDSLETLRLARNELHDSHCDHVVAYTALDGYKNETARVAAALSERSDLPEWKGGTLGAATRVDMPDGSRSWLDAQRSGISGDEVGVIVGEDTFGWSTPTEIKNGKLAPVTDVDVAALEGRRGRTDGPAGRASAWRSTITSEYATDHPQETVMACSGMWRNPEHPHLNVAADAVLSSDGGATVDGLLSSKSSSDASRFTDGLPPSYRAQMASQLHATGLNRGVVAVKIDDQDTRYFPVSVDDPINGQPGGRTIADHQDKLASTWKRWQDEKQNPPGPRPNKSTFGWVKKPGSDKSRDTNRTIAADLAAYRGISQGRATKLIEDGIYQGKTPDKAVRDLYATYDPATNPHRRYVTLDFETSARSAGRGEVIQTGVVVTDGRGVVLERIDELHSIDPRIRDTQGTGRSDIHGITPPMVDGKTPFQQSASYTRVKELLSDPRCSLVAHNAQFEKTMLRANGIGATRVIDTMRLRQRFDHGTVGSTNADFCHANGVEYVNGHNAAADADMTSRALHGFMRRLFNAPPGFGPK